MAVRPARSAGTQVEAELGGDNNVFPERCQTLPDQLFVRERAIDLGGIKERDAASHRRSDESDHILLVWREAAMIIHSHAAETDRRNFKTAFS